MSRPRFDITGKVVLITGAGQGIGRELARLLHERGAVVVLVDVNGEAVRRAASELGGGAFAVVADVADRAQMDEAVADVVERCGRLDVVVANAGVAPGPATIRALDPGEYDRVLGINLTGVFNTVHPALDAVVAAAGHVVVLSSVAAFAPGMGGSPYMISKAAVEQLGRALRVELAALGASAGIAYFGIVETPMARDMFDGHELGGALERLLPWPLNVPVTAEDAASTIADGIARRAPRTIAPAAWRGYALFRGLINAVLDRKLARDKKVHALVRAVDARREDRGT